MKACIAPLLHLCFLLGPLTLSAAARADELPPCFDFEMKTINPLRELPTAFDPEKDPTDKGHVEKVTDKLGEHPDFDWATVNGVVNKTIQTVYTELLNPRTIRDDPKTDIKLSDIENKNFAKLQSIKIHTKPVFFLTLDWEERWGFQITEGTAAAPLAYLISYQKTEGTSHIKLLCGNIYLKSLPLEKGSKDARTGVFFYEKMNASKRNAQDILNNITGTLRTLREPGVVMKAAEPKSK